MSVYVDDYLLSAEVPNGNRSVKARWSHMLADTRQELDTMAAALNMRPSWIQYPDTWKEHYDVVAGKRLQAIRLGAIPIACLSQEWVDVQNAKRLIYGKTLLRENLTAAHITVLIGAVGRYQSRCLIHGWFGDFYDYREFAVTDADNHNSSYH